jgi:hypothetical protein
MNDKAEAMFQTGGTEIGGLEFIRLSFVERRLFSHFVLRISD